MTQLSPKSSSRDVSRIIARVTTGIDLIEIHRISGVMERHGQRFLRKVYTDREITYCSGRPSELAARFAAKEATSKALGTGLNGIFWRDMEILSDLLGKPQVILHRNALVRAKELGIIELGVSLAHTKNLAIASVVGLIHELE